MGDLEPPAPKPGDVLVDSRGSAHIISRPLGAAPSGYGKLWLTTDPTILVKIMKSHPPDLSAVDLLGLPMAQPLALLKPPYRGQILELKSGTLEVEELMASPSPAKQLAILRRTAEVLAVLHSAGWVFGDLNPRNILAWPDAEEVVLVDLDTLAENRVAFGKSSSAHIKRARVLGLVPPWGLPGSAAQIDDTFVLVGFVGQAGGTRPELEVISPNTAVVVDEVARLINRPSTDTPSMGTLWAAMCMDEDRRRRCPLCGCLHCHSDSCPNCQYSSPATLIKFTSKSDNRVTTSTLHADPRNRARIRRRHIFAGPRATRDDCRYLVEINSGSVSVLSAVDDHQLPIGVPVELADELGAATVCIEVQDGC